MQEFIAYNVPVISVRKECFNNAHKWIAPSADEIKFVLSQATLTTASFAKMINEDHCIVDAWLTSNISIPYSAWCLLCISAGYGQIWK